jgi:hypothetical protein
MIIICYDITFPVLTFDILIACFGSLGASDADSFVESFSHALVLTFLLLPPPPPMCDGLGVYMLLFLSPLRDLMPLSITYCLNY